MPSRFAYFFKKDEIKKRYNLDEIDVDFYDYYNVKPTNRVTGLVWNDQNDSIEVVRLRWGFVKGKQFFKARAETISEKKMFGKAFRERRCLILANGFFEWDKEDPERTPYYFKMKDDSIFTIAGLYNSWEEDDDEETQYSVAIITVDANDVVSDIFHRMPAIIQNDNEEIWLNPKTDPNKLQELLKPYNATEMECYPVNPLPSRGDNGPETIEPAATSASLDEFF